MILQKIRDKGFKWFFWRLGDEFRNPKKPLSKSLVDSYLRLTKKFSNNGKKSDDLLYCIYDLKISPITFDISESLIDFEYEAKRQEKKGFVVVFVPEEDPPPYTWEEYEDVISPDTKPWRFHNIVLPITLMSVMCKGVLLLPKRTDVSMILKEKITYPDLYDGVNLRVADAEGIYKKLNKPSLVKGFRASSQGLKYIENWKKTHKINSPIVSITLRQSEFDKARNSNIKEWGKFVEYLKEHGYFPVIVPDTDNSFVKSEVFEGTSVFSEVCWNIELRMALYESCFVNFFSPNGPQRIAVWNSKCSYICMNFLPKESIVTTEDYFKLRGIEIGKDYKFALPGQHLAWSSSETFENMVQEFESFIKVNE